MNHVHVVKDDDDSKYRQDCRRYACQSHWKKLKARRRELKMYGGAKCGYNSYFKK